MEKAVADAKTKAEVLTKASGITLGDIQTIDYSWGEVRMTRPRLGKIVAAAAASESDDSYDVDFEPEDIYASDTVTVVWEIR